MEALRYDTYFVEDNIHGDSKVLGVISFFSVQFVENRLKSGTVDIQCKETRKLLMLSCGLRARAVESNCPQLLILHNIYICCKLQTA